MKTRTLFIVIMLICTSMLATDAFAKPRRGKLSRHHKHTTVKVIERVQKFTDPLPLPVKLPNFGYQHTSVVWESRSYDNASRVVYISGLPEGTVVESPKSFLCYQIAPENGTVMFYVPWSADKGTGIVIEGKTFKICPKYTENFYRLDGRRLVNEVRESQKDFWKNR